MGDDGEKEKGEDGDDVRFLALIVVCRDRYSPCLVAPVDLHHPVLYSARLNLGRLTSLPPPPSIAATHPRRPVPVGHLRFGSASVHGRREKVREGRRRRTAWITS